VRNVWRSREVLMGQSFQILYPSADEYERLGAHMAPILNAKGHYADNRIMKRANGELFWCHVSGRALNRDAPHASGIWSFEDLSSQRPVKAELTGREREVAAPAGRPDLQGNRQGPGDQPPHGGDLPRPPHAQVQRLHRGRPGAQAAGGAVNTVSAAGLLAARRSPRRPARKASTAVGTPQ
jgi:hypothetical protein